VKNIGVMTGPSETSYKTARKKRGDKQENAAEKQFTPLLFGKRAPNTSVFFGSRQSSDPLLLIILLILVKARPLLHQPGKSHLCLADLERQGSSGRSSRSGRIAGSGSHLHWHNTAEGSCAGIILASYKADVVLSGHGTRAALRGRDGSHEGEVGRLSLL
jgi:hypothetical protein